MKTTELSMQEIARARIAALLPHAGFTGWKFLREDGTTEGNWPEEKKRGTFTRRSRFYVNAWSYPEVMSEMKVGDSADFKLLPIKESSLQRQRDILTWEAKRRWGSDNYVVSLEDKKTLWRVLRLL